MASKTTNISRLLDIVARLRGPGGCPWDREQTHQSIRLNLLEESYEAIEAMDLYLAECRARWRAKRRGRARRPAAEAFQEELGDLLMQVAFHAQIAKEAGEFTFEDVAGAISEKLVRRHPHVFGKNRLKTSEQVLRQWEAIKQEEKSSDSILTHVPRSLPALLKADKVQRKAARVGFDWRRREDVMAKVEEELAELKESLASGNRRRVAEELGDLLFSVVNLARFENYHAEELLNAGITKFVGRFQKIERELRRRGRRWEDCTLEELDAIWESTKRSRRSRSARATRQR